MTSADFLSIGLATAGMKLARKISSNPMYKFKAKRYTIKVPVSTLNICFILMRGFFVVNYFISKTILNLVKFDVWKLFPFRG